MTSERQLLDANEAAAFLGVARRTLWRWAREGTVPHRKLGGRLLTFRRDELLTWVNAQPGRTVAEAIERAEGRQ